jgi:biotin transport system substrate-specific component
MSNLQELPKPDADITDYEWEVTPPTVKVLLERLQKLLKQKQKNLEHLQFENHWLREQLDIKLNQNESNYLPPLPEILLWAIVGLILTIGGTFVQAYTVTAPWFWFGKGLAVQTLGVSYQIGAVLLTGCVGGANAALLSQLLYVCLGLFGLPIFDRGGGWQYLQEPHFGYLLGFIFGAWLCGFLAFRQLATLFSLISSCLVGLVIIHLSGILYLTVLYYTSGLGRELNSIWQGILIYSWNLLPGQLAVVCAAASIALVMRKLMFS